MKHACVPHGKTWPTRALCIGLAAALALGVPIVASADAAPQFTVPEAPFNGRIRTSNTPVVLAGQPVTLGGRGFIAGQTVTLRYGGVTLGEPAKVDKDGTFSTTFTVPADADAGQYQIVASATNPTASMLVPFKISPDVPLSGQDAFQATFKPLVPGLYQVVYSPKSDALFVAATTVKSGPDGQRLRPSQLVKVDPDTLELVSAAKLATVPKEGQDKAYPVYGIDIDDAHGNVWTTNTQQGTVTVYRQSDLGLVKQFKRGLAPHARDVAVDETQGKAFVSAIGKPRHIVVIDTATLEPIGEIAIETTRKGRGAKPFTPVGMTVNEAASRLFVASMSTNEVAVIDTKTGKVLHVWPLKHSATAFDVAYDPQTKRIFVVSQGSDNLQIIDATSGKLLHDVATGGSPIDVAFDPVNRLAYVANRGSGTITVVDPDGKIVANLDGGSYPNTIRIDGKGGVYTTNKSFGKDDPEGDRIGHIIPD